MTDIVRHGNMSLWAVNTTINMVAFETKYLSYLRVREGHGRNGWSGAWAGIILGVWTVGPRADTHRSSVIRSHL